MLKSVLMSLVLALGPILASAQGQDHYVAFYKSRSETEAQGISARTTWPSRVVRIAETGEYLVAFGPLPSRAEAEQLGARAVAQARANGQSLGVGYIQLPAGAQGAALQVSQRAISASTNAESEPASAGQRGRSARSAAATGETQAAAPNAPTPQASDMRASNAPPPQATDMRAAAAPPAPPRRVNTPKRWPNLVTFSHPASQYGPDYQPLRRYEMQLLAEQSGSLRRVLVISERWVVPGKQLDSLSIDDYLLDCATRRGNKGIEARFKPAPTDAAPLESLDRFKAYPPPPIQSAELARGDMVDQYSKVACATSDFRENPGLPAAWAAMLDNDKRYTESGDRKRDADAAAAKRAEQERKDAIVQKEWQAERDQKNRERAKEYPYFARLTCVVPGYGGNRGIAECLFDAANPVITIVNGKDVLPMTARQMGDYGKEHWDGYEIDLRGKFRLVLMNRHRGMELRMTLFDRVTEKPIQEFKAPPGTALAAEK